MDKVTTFLTGKRTYIIATAAAVVVFLHQAGYIDQQVYETLLGLLGAGALTTLRLAIKK